MNEQEGKNMGLEAFRAFLEAGGGGGRQVAEPVQ
jgi:hypothetical protein